MTTLQPDLRTQLRERYLREKALRTDVQSGAEPTPPPLDDRAFVAHGASGRTVITAPLRETAQAGGANAGFMYLHGRFVEADTPNRNGALWSSEDLQLAERTVAGGPLNWLHEETHIIGTLLSGEFQKGRIEAGIGNHITSTAALWHFLFPREAAAAAQAAVDGRLYYSMECVSETVTCASNTSTEGCGEAFAYPDYLGKRACSHLNDRQSAARFDKPVFLGGALIVPPTEPGWARADVEVVRQAAQLTEENDLGAHLERKQAEHMVERILAWANR